MKFEDFKALTEEEQQAVFTSMEEKGILYDDMEAERNSFKSENEQLKAENSEVKAEIKKTKELNFTLARQFKSEPVQSAEDILHDMFSNRRRNT